MASDAKAMPLTLLAADLLDRLATAYADLEPGPYTDRDGMIGSARRLAASLRQDYTPPVPDAGGGAAFAALVDTLMLTQGKAVIARNNLTVDRFEREQERDAARAALLAAHAAAVQAERDEAADLEASFELRHAADMRAIAAWREAGPGRELRQPGHEDLCVFLLDALDGCKAAMRAEAQRLHDGAADIIAKAEADADAAGYARAMAIAERCLDRAEVATENFPQNERVGHYADGIASVIRALSVATPADTASDDAPTLVHGGPPRDSLDDGR